MCTICDEKIGLLSVNLKLNYGDVVYSECLEDIGVGEKETIECLLPAELYQAVHGIVTALDTEYGADREVYNSDGSYVMILENVQDIKEAATRYIQIDKDEQPFGNFLIP